MAMEYAEVGGMLVLAGTLAEDGASTPELLRSPARAAYNRDEQRLSVLVERELDRMIVGGCEQLVLLKLFPQGQSRPQGEPTIGAQPAQDARGAQSEGTRTEHARPALQIAWPAVNVNAVRPATILALAAEAINFFGPLHGGVVTQTAFPDVIVQERRFTTAYPHINLERYDVYAAQTSAPVLGAWRARRLQNQRRETRTNRMIDIALLMLEVSQAVFPKLLR